MKLPRYSLRTLLLAITFACIAFSGFSPLGQVARISDAALFWMLVVFFVPPLISSGFVGYAIGRKALTVRSVIVFAIAQGIAIGAIIYLVSIEDVY